MMMQENVKTQDEWTTPDFEEISVNCEVKSYCGAETEAEDPHESACK